MAHEASGNDAAATEHSNETQLAELLNQEAGQTGEYELKVTRSVVHNTKARSRTPVPHSRTILPWRRKATEARQKRTTEVAPALSCR